jgi:hypothetical protein
MGVGRGLNYLTHIFLFSHFHLFVFFLFQFFHFLLFLPSGGSILKKRGMHIAV